jgi:poly-beta-1,6-N-acetyl-D-glucosamine synthase
MSGRLLASTGAIRKLLVYLLLYLVTGALIASVFLLTPEGRTEFPLLRAVIIGCASILLGKYFLYMLVSPWYDVLALWRLSRKTEGWYGPEYSPRVSVLIPAWNEENGVVTTARALLSSTYKNLEVLIINNASTDGTKKNVLKLVREHGRSRRGRQRGIDLVYLEELTQGKGHALNRGIESATGDIILSIDADCYVPPDAVANFVKYFRDPSVMAAVGNVKIGNTRTILGVTQYLEFLFSFYFKKGDSVINSIYIIGGAAGAFRREVFEQVGRYSTTNITEDIELSVRIQDAGMKIVYAPDALVFTEGAMDIWGLMKQRLRWKRGRFETFVDHRHLFFSTKKKHNKLLSWVILPLAIFGEVQLFLELFFLAFLYAYSYLTSDYSSFISGIVVVSSMFAIQVLFDENKKKSWFLILLAPIGWLLFYVSTLVEFQALIRSTWGYVRGKELKWQKWERNGVFAG